MLPDGPAKQLARQVAALVHKEKKLEAAQAINEFCQLGLKLTEDNPEKYHPVLSHYLHYLLNNGATEEAAQLLWTPNQFTPEPQFTKDLWDLFDTANMGLIMGGASCSKSFGIGVRIFLEWLRDPQWTAVKVVGPSENHLEANLFSHLVRLHSKAALPMPGEVGELFIGIDRRDLSSAIRGVVIPVGRVKKKAGRLQGTKRIPRKEAHHIFGALSRVFVFVDEIENVPAGLWGDIDNILSMASEHGKGGFKIFGAFNPSNQQDEVGKRAEPVFGWDNFDAEKHFRWTSLRGWEVLRLDGEKSENVVQNKEVFPGLQTRAGLELISRNAGGRNSAGYFTMGRGAYPPSGIELTIIPPGMLPKIKGEFIWFNAPEPVGACDLALEGGSAAIFTLGRWGMASGMKKPPSVEHPKGEVIMFKDRNGQVSPRWALQADQQFTVPKGDTVKMKTQLIEVCKKAGVRPHFFCCDRTGHGTGIADLMIYEWSQAIHAINYSEAPTKDKLMSEDTKTCHEEFERLNSELWFALRAWSEFGYFLLGPQIDMTNLAQQLTQRKFRKNGTKTRVEAKKDYMDRLGLTSPDEADSLTLLVHSARKGSGTILSMRGDMIWKPGEGTEDDFWPGDGGVRLDPTSRTDFLDQGIR